MYVAVAGLIGIVATVALQVFGRYVLNDTPTWAESTALVLILYVTMLGAAVGVRDAGHIGLESLLILVPDGVRLKLEMVIHAAGRHLRPDHGVERRGAGRIGDGLQDPDPRPARRHQPPAAGDRRHPDRPVLPRAHRGAVARRGGEFRRGTDHPLRRLRRLPAARRAGRLLDRPLGRRHHPLRGPAARRRVPAHDVGHEHLLVPRHPVLHLRRRADALWRRRRPHRGLRQKPGRPCARRPRHGQCRGLHPVRRRLGLAGRRRLGHRRRHDPDDEEGRLSRRLRRQRDHPCRPGRRADADQPQHDHLFAGGRRKSLDHRADPGRHAAGGAADDLHAGRGLPGGDQARLSRRHLPRLERRAARPWPAPSPACSWSPSSWSAS